MAVTPPQPGSAPYRTGLAWRRTTLAFVPVGLLLGRLIATGTTRLVAAAGLTVIGLSWLVMVGLSRHRTRILPRPVGRALPTVVLLIMVYCGLGMLLLVSSG